MWRNNSVFTKVLHIRKRLCLSLKEVQVKGNVAGDITGLEDPSAVNHVIDIISADVDSKV